MVERNIEKISQFTMDLLYLLQGTGTGIGESFNPMTLVREVFELYRDQAGRVGSPTQVGPG